jgi:hypothetical protein
MPFGQASQTLLAARDRFDRVALFGKNRAEGVTDAFFVVHDENGMSHMGVFSLGLPD